MALDLGMTPHLKSSIKRKTGLNVLAVSTKITTRTKIHLSKMLMLVNISDQTLDKMVHMLGVQSAA